jgi:hypothetical protein
VRLVRLLPLALLAAIAVPGGADAAPAQAATKECNGIRQCISVRGPWVAIPPRTEVTYLLDCPRRQGIVGGLDVIASSADVRVSFEARIGSPVAPGRSTTRYAVFRAVTASGRRAVFKPLIGCIPSGSPSRNTTAIRALPGPPLEYAQTTFLLRPGAVRTATIGCVGSQRLLRTWYAVAFRTERMPQAALAEAVRVERTKRGRQVAVRISTSEALPRGAKAEVQVGVVCAA